MTQIRTIQPDDYDQWHGLWTDYLEFYNTSVPDAIYRTTFDRLLSADCPAQQALVAEQDGTLGGLVHFIYHPHNWKIENVCYLQDLYVSDRLQGGGIGRQLIEAVYDAADAAGCPSVYWLTQDFNTKARYLYDNIAKLDPFVRYSRK